MKLETQARTAKVLVSLVIAMTVGAFVLMALDRKSISAGPFSLSSYTNLNPVADVARHVSTLTPHGWEGVEVYYSKTGSGGIDALAQLEQISSSNDVNFHFVICNGQGAVDGFIEATKRWQMQRPCLPGGNWYGDSGSIRVCVIADGIGNIPTDCQIKRTTSLVELLSRQFQIAPARISYPLSWKL